MLTLVVFAAQAFSDPAAYIQSRAHTAVRDTSVLARYNTSTLGAEVDALPDPSSGGFEYWPYVYDEQTGAHPHPYPDMIQWGFSSGGDTARRCMKLSYHVWRYVQDHKPANLVALEGIEGSPRSYYHWNNDFTQARSDELGYRTFWHYNRPNGLLKWISHTKMDGTCQHPTVEAIDRWAQCEILRLQDAPEQCPGHR